MSAFAYPVSLELRDRPCVVVGGGSVAEQKVRGLLAAGAKVRVVSDHFTEGLQDLERPGSVELVSRPYSYGDLEGAFLAIAATDDRAVNAEVFKEAEEGRVLLNSVDDVEHCHFAVPSLLRRGDLTVAISTGGKAPALAKRLRSSLEAQLAPEWAAVVDLLAQVREEALETRKVDFDTWARRWHDALQHDLAALVREGRVDEAKDLVRRSLAGEPHSGGGEGAEGRVAIVGAGPGDPGLLTVRARQLLDEADVVVHDRLVDPSLVEGRNAIFVGKQAGHHVLPQGEINALLVDLAREGKRVVRLKGGDPFVFGRGAEEAEALAEAGVHFEVVPGATSAIAALASAGIPVTDRRLSSSVALVTGHCTQSEADWSRLATAVDTIVVLMGLARLEAIVAALVGGGRDPAEPAAIVENGTRPDQRVVTAPLAELPSAAAEARVVSPAVVVVGEVVRLRDRIQAQNRKIRMTGN